MAEAQGSAGRIFVAAPLHRDTRDQIARHLASELGGRRLPGRMVPTENWHLTLRFLGETSTGQLDTVRRDLRSANLGRAFVLVFTGLGAFPSAGRARVLWLGTSAGADSLGSLAAAVEGVVGAAGFPPEARPFKAHLTLGRMNPEADVRDVIRCVRPIDLPAAVDRVVVYRSHLSPRGASYEVVDTVALPEATDGANL